MFADATAAALHIANIYVVLNLSTSTLLFYEHPNTSTQTHMHIIRTACACFATRKVIFFLL